MKYIIYIVLFAALIGLAFVLYNIGYSAGINDADLDTAVKNMPRGGLDIPAQWLMMDSMVGPEKMMLVFGYADNESVCSLLKTVAESDAPDRDFWCEDAN